METEARTGTTPTRSDPARAEVRGTAPAAALVPLADEVVSRVQHQVRTMDDTTFTLAVAGLVLILALVMLGIRPKY